MRYAFLCGGAEVLGTCGARMQRDKGAWVRGQLFWCEPCGETQEDPSVLVAEVNECFS